MLKALSLWDKKDSKIITLSGGMKRRLMIAKALSHEPTVLFLDEPTAGVDVNLRRDMWQLVRELRASGVTIILTTHYIEEAEEMADRIGVINKGELILVEEKAELMRKLGKKQLTLQLSAPLPQLPPPLAAYDLALSADRTGLTYTFDSQRDRAGHRHPDRRPRAPGHRLQGPAHHRELARGHLRRPAEGQRMSHLRSPESVAPGGDARRAAGARMTMNWHAVRAIYRFEMARTRRTLMQSIVSPVISTSLYFIVFGAAIGSRIPEMGGVAYGAFIVPGLVMLSLLTQSISNASFGIYFPKFTGTDLRAAVGAGVGVRDRAQLRRRRGHQVDHPRAHHHGHRVAVRAAAHRAPAVDGAVSGADGGRPSAMLGFIIGIWADGFEKLQVVPLLIITPLTFLGGSFYSIDMLPPFWQKVALLNPVVYLISGFRWSFYGVADVGARLEPGHDVRLSRRVAGRRGVDLPHGVSAEDLKTARTATSAQ